MKPRLFSRLVLICLLAGLTVVACAPAAPTTPLPGATASPSPLPIRPSPIAEGRCGDGICDQAERANPELCPQDCLLTPAPQPEATKPTQGRCGDGICDEMEQKDPALCPQDCATPTAPPAVTVAVTRAGPTLVPAASLTPTPQPKPTSASAGVAWESVTLASGEVAHLGDPATVSQQGGVPGAARQANVALILDASGSMNAALPRIGKTKLAVAKEVMAEVIPQIPAEVHGALWIYGHRYPQEPKDKSCQDIERVFSLGPVDATAYVAQVNAITAIGYTPIADSIEQAAQDLPAGDFNSIVLVSDGEETCGGDPCALAEALKASDATVIVHVVGYAVEDVARQQLQCIAQVSGGTYHDAEDATELLQALADAMGATATETILRVEVVGPDGAQVHANPRLYEAGTDRLVSGYVTWVDNAVPPGTFDLLIDTLPRTLYQELTIEEGSTTIVQLALGAVRVRTPDQEETTFDIYDAGSGQRLGYYGGTLFVVPGSYRVGINNSTSQVFAVDAGETEELLLGALRALTPDREETTVNIYDATGKRLGYYGGTVLLVPGSYQVEINNSTSQVFAVNAGKTEELLLGAIEVKGDFEIYDATGKRLGWYKDSLLLVPGTYTVKVSDGATFENVVVKVGEVTALER
jgi:hypothetical protein